MSFPIRPLLDRVIVREIPVKEYYETSDLVQAEMLDRSDFKALSDRGVVVSIGNTVTEVQEGDTVMFDEFARNDELWLNPAHKNRSDLPRYFQMRVADLKGVIGEARKIVGTDMARFDEKRPLSDSLRVLI